MKPLSLTWLCLMLLLKAAGQEGPEIDLQVVADDIFGAQDDPALNYSDLYENLALLLSNPLDLNKATKEELRLLYMLNESQIGGLLAYRRDHGDLISVYELQTVPGFDPATLARMMPFVKITAPFSTIDGSLLNRIVHERNNYFLVRYERTLEKKRGFEKETAPDQKFTGSPDKFYTRFRTSRPGDFSLGFTLEKDAGERLAWNGRQKGFDFASFHAQLLHKGKIKNLVVGDYQIQAGQGLLLGGVFGLGKGGETVTGARRTNLGIMPYTSANENSYRRGIAATIELTPNFLLTGFYARSARDASVTADSTETYSLQSLQATGMHRNARELEGMDAVTEVSYGAIVNYRNNRTDAGLIWNTTGFGLPFHRRATRYNQFAFRGQTNDNLSVFLNYNLDNVTFFGEAAKSLNAGTAVVAGLLGSLSRTLDIALLYRNYRRDFYTFYANAFGESSTTQNETGLYWGWKYRWNKKYSLAGYVDLFRFPWLRYRSYAPSDGYEWLLRFNYQPSRATLLYLQVREENKMRNDTGNTTTTYATGQGAKRNYLFNVQVAAGKNLRLKTRVQYSTYTFNGRQTRGLVLVQDIRWKLGRFTLNGRHALFDTDDYDNRQYVYENDVRLAFSIPAYYGHGVRNYLLIDYKINAGMSCALRLARTRYINRDTIGSGLDTIAGNTRNDIKFQLFISL